jgi:hypothetical protein
VSFFGGAILSFLHHAQTRFFVTSAALWAATEVHNDHRWQHAVQEKRHNAGDHRLFGDCHHQRHINPTHCGDMHGMPAQAKVSAHPSTDHHALQRTLA